MQEEQQFEFEDLFTNEQIETILQIDESAGYIVEDHRRICEALNQTQPRQLRQFFSSIQSKRKTDKNFLIDVTKYKHQIYFDEECDQELLDHLESYPPTLPAGYRLPPIIENLTDEQKFEILYRFSGDLGSAFAFLTALIHEEGEDTIWEFFYKLWPKICAEAREFSLSRVIHYKSKKDKFLTDSTVPRLILQDVLRGDEVWLQLLKLPPNLPKIVSEQAQKLFKVGNFLPREIQELTNNLVRTASVQTRTASKLTVDGFPEDEADSDPLMDKSKAIQMVWNILNPISRKLITDRLMNKPNLIALDFYRHLDLDSRVEYLSDKDDKFLNKFWKLYENEPIISETRKHMQQELEMLKSENIHHKYFHLREGFDENETNDQKDQDSKTEPMLEKLVKGTAEDIKKTWNVIPFDRPGDYLQCLPKPGTTDEFYVIQPYGLKASCNQNRVFGRLEPYSHPFNKDETPLNISGFQSPIAAAKPLAPALESMGGKFNLGQILSVIQKTKQKAEAVKKADYCKQVQKSKQVVAIQGAQEVSAKVFGVVSTWKYAGSDMGIFQCEQSFATPEIIALSDGSKKVHNQTFLFKSEEDEIFFFCKEESKSKEVLTDNEETKFTRLYICIMKKKTAEEEKLNSKLITDNVEKVRVSNSSELFQVMIPEINKDKGDQKEMLFQQTPPTLIKTGSDRLCVFSIFRLRKDHGPSLCFYSFKHQQTIKKVGGGEIFIDFIPLTETPGTGYLYYMTDECFYNTEWKLLKSEKSVKNRTQESQYVIVKIKIDFEINQGEAQAQKSISRQEKASWVTSFKNERINDAISRQIYWIKWIKPILRTGDSLDEFAVSIVNQLTREKSVVIVTLSGKQNIRAIMTQGPMTQIIKEDNIANIFLQKRINEDGKWTDTIIQVVVQNNDMLEFGYYDKDSHKYDDERQDQSIKEATGSYRKFRKKQFTLQKRGLHIVPMEIRLNEQVDEMAGCFINRDDYSIHWIHEKFKGGKRGKNSQSFSTLPQHQIDYPILCFERPYPDGREIAIINLADMSAARNSLCLSSLKFICFVGHRSTASDRSSICFLARDDEEIGQNSMEQTDTAREKQIKPNQSIVHCIIHCEKVFQKKADRNMSHYDVEVESLGRKSQEKAFQKYLASAVTIESMHDLEAQRLGDKTICQCFVIQTLKDISIYTHYEDDRGLWKHVTVDNLMKPLTMQRGSGGKFYFVESDLSVSSDILYELHVQKVDNKWIWSKKPVFELTSGRAIALELNPDNIRNTKVTKKIQGGSRGKKGKVTTDRTITNQIFLVDEQFMLWLLIEDPDSNTYFSFERHSLASFKNLAPSLRYLKQHDWARASITENCITIQGCSLNFKDLYSWDFVFKDKVEKWKWKVQNCLNIQGTHRQLIIATRQDQGCTENAFVVKLHPSSRKVSLVGDKRLPAIELIDFIANQLLLFKMQGNYWCLIDTWGQIKEIPERLLHFLNNNTFTKMETQTIYDRGTILLMLQADKYTVTVEFSHRGEVKDIQEFNEPTNQTKSYKKQTQVSLFADKYGLVYRLSHAQVEGECEPGVQNYNLQESSSANVIQKNVNITRKNFHLMQNENSKRRSLVNNITDKNENAIDLDQASASSGSALTKSYGSKFLNKLSRKQLPQNSDRPYSDVHDCRNNLNVKSLQSSNHKLQSGFDTDENEQSFGDSNQQSLPILRRKQDDAPTLQQQSQQSIISEAIRFDHNSLNEQSSEQNDVSDSQTDAQMTDRELVLTLRPSGQNKHTPDKIEPELEPENPKPIARNRQIVPLNSETDSDSPSKSLQSNNQSHLPQRSQHKHLVTPINIAKATGIRARNVIPLNIDTETDFASTRNLNSIRNPFQGPTFDDDINHSSRFSAEDDNNISQAQAGEKKKDLNESGTQKQSAYLKVIDIVLTHSKIEFDKIEQDPPFFLICGDFLCWQKDNEKAKIHVTALDDLNLVSRKEQKYQKLFNDQPKVQENKSRLNRKVSVAFNVKGNTGKIQIRNKELKSQVIDLIPYMIDTRVKDIHFSVAPLSTHLHQRTQSEINFEQKASVNINLLQVTISDRAIIFDLSQYLKELNCFLAIRDFSDMKQLINPERYVCSEFNVQNSYSQPQNSKIPLYRICRQIYPNKSNDFFFEGQTWEEITCNIDPKEDNMVPSKVFGVYKTYSETDFEELKRIYKNIKDKTVIKKLDLEVLCSLFIGRSIFSTALHMEILKSIEDKLELKTLGLQDDKDDNQGEHHFFRRLYQTLMIPIPQLQNKYQGRQSSKQTQVEETNQFLGMFSCLEMIAYSANTSSSEKLMQIALLCKQTSLICFADTIEDVRELFRSKASQAVKLVDHSFFETCATKKINSVTWPKDETFLVFQHKSCLLDTSDCMKGVEQAYIRHKSRLEYWYYTRKLKRKLAKKKQQEDKEDKNLTGSQVKKKTREEMNVFDLENKDMTINTVHVRLIDLGWLYADEKVFLDFVGILQEIDSSDLYASEFVKTLIQVFWQENETKVFRKIFLPYICYLGLTLLYTVNIVNGHDIEQQGVWFYVGLLDIFIVFYQIYIETTQIQQTGLVDYMASVMNLLDMFQYLSNLFLIFITLTEIRCIDDNPKRVWCAILVVLMWSKMLDWLRMFDKTSFYIALILTTISDILPFFAIFPVFIFAFGSAMLILDSDGDQSTVMGHYGDNSVFNVFMNQYLLSVGYFDSLEQYKISEQSEICFVFFVLASFFLQITALNMIIAIMSDTFTKVTENYEQYSRSMKIGILSDYIKHIRHFGANEDNAQFLAVCTRVSDSKGDSDWEGTLNAMRSTMQRHSDDLNVKFDGRIQEVKDMMDVLQSKLTIQDKETKKQINEQNGNIKQITETISHDVIEVREMLANNTLEVKEMLANNSLEVKKMFAKITDKGQIGELDANGK